MQIANIGNHPEIFGGTEDISGYTVKVNDFAGYDSNNNSTFDISQQRIFADTSWNQIQNQSVNDPSATALDVPFLISRENSEYDISLNIWNKHDLSGAYLSYNQKLYSRPSDFVKSDISQNDSASTFNKIVSEKNK